MRVAFHGHLTEMVPPGIENIDFAVKTVGECVEAVSTQIPALTRGPRKRVQILGVQNEHDLLREDVEVVHIMPSFTGGKRGGFFQIILGGLLIAASILVPAGFLIANVALKTILFNAGLSLALSGVASLLAPKPPSSTSSGAAPEGSKYLGAAGNTVQIGTRIPVGYGRQKVYGHILSFNVSEQSLTAHADPTKALSLSQGSINFFGSRAGYFLVKAKGGNGPYTYTLSNISTPLSFNPTTRLLTITGASTGGVVSTYTATDADMNTVSVEVTIDYNFNDRDRGHGGRPSSRPGGRPSSGRPSGGPSGVYA